MPTLLAARASGRLSASDRAGVERHIARCADCRELERRRDEAEQAYGALLGQPIAPARPSEPFAPGDPEPEVAVARGEAGAVPMEVAAEPEPDEGMAEPDDGVATPEPEAVATAEPEALAEPERAPEPEPKAVAEPEPDALPEPEAQAEPDDEPRAFVDDRAPQPIAAEHEHEQLNGSTQAFTPAEERDATGSRRPRRTLLIAALFIAGVVILAVGLLQLGDDDGGTTAQQADQRAAQTAAPAPSPAAPAEPARSRAELRTRARLRVLGDRELGPGTVGDDVKALQRLLGVQQTGNYGDLTAFAVGQFQARHDLPATGIADEATKRGLARRPRPPRQAPTPPPTPAPAEPQGDQQQPPGATPETTPPPAGQAAPPSAPGVSGPGAE